MNENPIQAFKDKCIKDGVLCANYNKCNIDHACCGYETPSVDMGWDVDEIRFLVEDTQYAMNHVLDALFYGMRGLDNLKEEKLKRFKALIDSVYDTLSETKTKEGE